MNEVESFGIKLQYLRNRKDMSQRDLARILSTTRQSVSNWENDRNRPSFEIVLELSKIFGVTVDYLLNDRPSSNHI